jgi:hypothetical protein
MSSKRECRRRRQERAKRRSLREKYRPSRMAISAALTGVGTGALVVAPLVSVQPFRHDLSLNKLYAPLSAQADSDLLHIETGEPEITVFQITFGSASTTSIPRPLADWERYPVHWGD